jgi:hypothetical protein
MADVAGPLVPIVLNLLDFYGLKIRVGSLVCLQYQQPGIRGSLDRLSQTTKVHVYWTQNNGNPGATVATLQS